MSPMAMVPFLNGALIRDEIIDTPSPFPPIMNPSPTTDHITPSFTNSGGNQGGNDNSGDQSPPDPYSGQSEGIEGGNEGISKDCAYWRSQGFVCSTAIPSRVVQLWNGRFITMIGLLWWANFGWILCGF